MKYSKTFRFKLSTAHRCITDGINQIKEDLHGHEFIIFVHLGKSSSGTKCSEQEINFLYKEIESLIREYDQKVLLHKDDSLIKNLEDTNYITFKYNPDPDFIGECILEKIQSYIIEQNLGFRVSQISIFESDKIVNEIRV